MPRLTGTVASGSRPAAWAYVQLTNLAGDFQGEVRADGEGAFTLYPVPGHWRLVTWSPSGEWGRRFTQHEVDQLLARARARALGVNLLDTAECYGDHLTEALIGAASAVRR